MKYTDPDGEFAIAIPLIPVAIEGIKDAALITGAILSGIVLGKVATDIVKDGQQDKSGKQKTENAKQQLESNAQSVTPNPLPPDPDDEDKENNQSAKDAKKIDSNKEANKFAQDKGYSDAHELKKDYVGKNNISKYDIYRNTKTGESFLINKNGTSIVPIE